MAAPQRKIRRWPRNADASRKQAIEAARDARDLLDEARKCLRSNPLLAEVQIADAMALLSDIRLVLGLAQIGADPPDDSDD